jgi:pyruvate/2-oxoglutarate dehydrogenase complex dihydrolipoamide dehydrogenase (E3) component
VVEGAARIVGRGQVEVEPRGGAGSGGGDGSGAAARRLSTRAVLVCSGSRPAVPEDLPGLAEAGYLTNETVFEGAEAPASLVVIGAGPIGVELAQAFARLGTEVTLLQRADRILERDEPDLADRLAARLRADGVDLQCGVAIERVEVRSGRKIVHGTARGLTREWTAAELLVAVGRRPNVEGLGLEEQGVVVGPDGVETDPSGRTAAGWIWAAGDVTGGPQFTHRAAYDAVRAVRDIALPGRGRAPAFVPWCTFTDPELAHAGLTEAEAQERHGDGVEVWRHELVHSDRARTDGATEGAVVVVTAKGRIVGAHALAPAAGELIHELALAVRDRARLDDLASLVHVYPTYATSVGVLAGDAAYRRADRYRWLVRARRLVRRR